MISFPATTTVLTSKSKKIEGVIGPGVIKDPTQSS